MLNTVRRTFAVFLISILSLVLFAMSLLVVLKSMERATATRGKALASIQGIVSVDTKVGTVEINLSR
jgi:hypothetical protein